MAVRAGNNGWSKVIAVTPAVAFKGTTATASVPLDISGIQSLIHQVEDQTGFKPGSYDLVVSPVVHVQGVALAQKIDEQFAPEYTILLSNGQLTPDAKLSQSVLKKVPGLTKVANHIATPVGTMNISTARIGGATGFVVFGVLSVVLAAFVVAGVGRSEPAKIRGRYGSFLVSVRDAAFQTDATKQIRLQSIADLVKLAKKDGRMILHHVADDGSHEYFVQDVDLTYLYLSPAPGAEAHPTLSEA